MSEAESIKTTAEVLREQVRRHMGEHHPCAVCGAAEAPLTAVIFLSPSWWARMKLERAPGLGWAIVSVCGACAAKPDANRLQDEAVAASLRWRGVKEVGDAAAD